MGIFNQSDLELAYTEVVSIKRKCESIQVKFLDGSAQHTLLKNRIKALDISKQLLENALNISDEKNSINIQESTNTSPLALHSKLDLKEALSPIISIINKCENAQKKYEVDTTQFNRYIKLIRSMYICKELIEDQLT